MPIKSIGGVSAYRTAPVSAIAGSSMAVVAGHALIVAVSMSDTSSSVASITDNAGNTFHSMQSSSNSGNVRVEIWQALGIIGYAVDFVTVNFSTPTICSLIVWELSGVKTETYPSPQDKANATGFNTQLTCGADCSSFTSWSIAIFGWVTDPVFQGFLPTRGTKISESPTLGVFISTPNVGLSMMYVRPYAVPSSPPAPGFVVPTPMGELFGIGSGLPAVPEQFAALTLELRSTDGTGGGIIPPNPPWFPPPDGTLVGWSFTYTVTATDPAAVTSADVTCSYLETVCDDDRTEPGNDAY